MKIQINISNKTAYVLMGILGLMIISGFVYAYNPDGMGGNPAVMGHSLDELSIPNCVDGQILKKVSGAWTCASDNEGSASPSATGNVIGGGFISYKDENGEQNCYAWGSASCTTGTFQVFSCPSGSTKRVTGFEGSYSSSYREYYICVAN